MLSCSRFFILALVLGALCSSKATMACGDYCGWSGAYDVGGYNLLGWAVDVQTIVDYSSVNYNQNCCTSCYDVSLLNGYSQQNAYYNMQLDNQIAQLTNQLTNMMTSMTNPTFSNYPQTFPGINPGGSYLGGNGFPGGSYGQPFPGMPFNPGMYTPPLQPQYYPTLTSIPPYLQQPVGGQSPYYPQITVPPYGGCDNIVVMCSSGPTVRNNPITPPVVTQPTTTIDSNDPIRYQVPRGFVTTH